MPTPGYLTDDQAIELLKQLPSERKFSLLLSLAKDSRETREATMAKAEEGLRKAAKQRGLSWDDMSEEDRIAFVDTLVHESRV